MSFSDLSQRRRFALVISGLGEVYYSHSADGLSAVPAIGTQLASGGAHRSFVESIVNVSDYSADLDPIGGVASYAPITVTLLADKRGAAVEAGTVLSRIGPRASSVSHAYLLGGIAHTDTPPMTVLLDRDVSAIYTAGDYAHIGAETFKVSAVTGGGAPSITLDARALADTPTQDHQSGLGGTSKPEMTSEVVYWRGRRASIWMSTGRTDGSWSGWLELMRGFIDSTPAINEGLAVSVDVVPLTALVDQGITGEVSRQTTLLRGFHEFEIGKNDTFEFAVEIGPGSINRANMPNIVGFGAEQWAKQGVAGGGPSGGTRFYTGRHYHAGLFDITLQRADGARYTGHPRLGEMELTDFNQAPGANSQRLTVLDYYQHGGLGIDNGYELDRDVSAFSYVVSEHGYLHPLRELHRYRQPAGVVLWPTEWLAAFNAASPSALAGLSGGWIDVSLREEGGRLVWQLTPQADHRFVSSLLTWSHPDAIFNAGIRGLRYWGPNGPQGAVSGAELMAVPIDTAISGSELYPHYYPDEAALEDAALYTRSWGQMEQQLQRYGNRDYALAYWQPAERVVLITDQLTGIPSVAGAYVYMVLCESYSPRHGRNIRQWLRVTHQTTASHGASVVGYRLHLTRRQRAKQPIVDWASRGSDGRAVISLATMLEDSSPGEVLLTLLESGGGGGVNGAYDTSALGLNLPASAIDEDSFLTLSSTSRLADLTLSLAGGDIDVRGIFDGLLRSLGAAVVLRRTSTANERLQLVCIPIGMEQSSRVSQTIAEGDWLVDPPPSWGIHEAAVNQLVVSYGFDPVESSFAGEVTINNQRALAAYSAERLSMELPLFGSSAEALGQNTADLYSALRPVFTRIFRIGSDPVRLWSGSVGFHIGHILEVGTCVSASSPHLRGYGDAYGVTDEIGMVRTIKQSLTGEGVSIDILHYQLEPTGWNASAEVAGVVSITTLEFNTITYTRGRTPAGASTTDCALFTAGDVVDYIPPGDEDNQTTLTVASVDLALSRITFTATHGVASGIGHIEPTSYDAAPASHTARAYLADASDTLGTAGNSGQRYL